MEIPELVTRLKEQHSVFVSYLTDLTAEQYLFSREGKWTAGQQLAHIVLCIKPLVQVYSMDKTMIEQMFGKSVSENRSYDGLLQEYNEKLKAGGKAPEKYLPVETTLDKKEILLETLTNMVNALCAKLEGFNDEELDSLLIPHPLLGNLTFREMAYNAIAHVNHHHEMAKNNLAQV